MLTNATISQPEINKKESQPIAETNKIISELSLCLTDTVPPTDSQKVDQPIPEDVSPIENIKDESIIKNKVSEPEVISQTNQTEENKEQEKKNNKEEEVPEEQLIFTNDKLFFEEKKDSILAGIADKKYFIEKQKENEEKTLCFIELSDFEFSHVQEDLNSGYRALSLQVYGTEEKYLELRQTIYDFLTNNLEKIKKYGFEREGNIMYADKYMEFVKSENENLGDLALFSFAYIFNAEIVLYELRTDRKAYLISECRRIEYKNKNKGKMFINLCIIRGEAFQVIYEKNREKNMFYDKEEIAKLVEKNIQTQEAIQLNFEYAKDKRRYTYKEIENFLWSKNLRTGEVYPEYINNLTNENKIKNKRREYREMAKKYVIDKDSGRLKIIFNISNRAYNKSFKEFYIVYQLEKFTIIRQIHAMTTHDEENCRRLDGMIKLYDFWWYGIHQDIKNFSTFCLECQKK